jgi:hypothetical protein
MGSVTVKTSFPNVNTLDKAAVEHSIGNIETNADGDPYAAITWRMKGRISGLPLLGQRLLSVVRNRSPKGPGCLIRPS